MEVKMDQYIYLTSDDSPTHTSNDANDFAIEIPRGIDMDGRWECALIETNRRQAEFYCDWCEDSVVGETWQPILRKVDFSIQLPLYVGVRRGSKSRIRIYVKGLSPPKTTKVALHLRYKSS